MFADPLPSPRGYIMDLYTGEAEVLKLSPDLSRCVLRLREVAACALVLTRLKHLLPVVKFEIF